MVSLQATTPQLSNVCRSYTGCRDIDIILCVITQNQPGSLGSGAGIPPCKVLELCQAACDMRGWQVAQGLPLAKIDLICEHEDDSLEIGTSTDAMIMHIWDLAWELFKSLQMTIADGHLLEAQQSDIGSEPLQECSTLINLLVVLRLWCGVTRCCKDGIALAHSAKSGSVSFSDIIPDVTLGKSINDCCRRLSELLPPHPLLLARSMADLLGLGLLDASFKWRHNTRNSSSPRGDRWWDNAVLTGVKPGAFWRVQLLHCTELWTILPRKKRCVQKSKAGIPGQRRPN